MALVLWEPLGLGKVGNAMESLLPLGQHGYAVQVPVPGFHADPGFASLLLRACRK